jgi:hypothetical protein
MPIKFLIIPIALCMTLDSAKGQDQEHIKDYFTNEKGTFGITDDGDTIQIFKSSRAGTTRPTTPATRTRTPLSDYSEAGAYFLAGGAFMVVGSGVGITGRIINDENSKYFYFTSVGLATFGALLIIGGGAKLFKAGKQKSTRATASSITFSLNRSHKADTPIRF